MQSKSKHAKSKINFASLKGKKVLLLCHENSDLDSFCSASIMQELLSAKKISCTIASPSHINSQTKYFAEQNKIYYLFGPPLEKYGAVFLFDFNDFEQLGALEKDFVQLCSKNSYEVFAFDHHVVESTSVAKGKNAFVDDSCLSTTQVLYNLFGKEFNKNCFFYNCLGLLEDTGHFTVGNHKAFCSFADSLNRSGRTYAEVLLFAKHQVPNDERIAFLKAAQRSKVQKIGEVVVVTSELSFYQSSAASKLLDFGAHIALVAGKEKQGITTLSARAESVFKEKYSFNLMKHLMIPLQLKLPGNIGGHSGAAQWKGNAEPQKVLGDAVNMLKLFWTENKLFK